MDCKFSSDAPAGADVVADSESTPAVYIKDYTIHQKHNQTKRVQKWKIVLVLMTIRPSKSLKSRAITQTKY